jgi:DNA-binding NarL/FixJ family response regulator
MHRILIADDHPVMREGLAYVLGHEPDFEICGKAASVGEALELAAQTRPDVVVTDLSFPERSGLELIKDLATLKPGLPVIAISMHDELIYAERVFRAGGKGYLMKESVPALITEAVRRVLAGGVHASQAVTDHLLRSMAGNSKAHTPKFPLKRLSDRELEIFELIGHGKNPREIAENLHISARTVDAHRGHIREKLGLADSTDLTCYAIRWIESGNLE